jgi:hypothetical protein
MLMSGVESSDLAFVEAVARRVVELLHEEGEVAREGPRLLTAAQVAEEFGVSTDWLYANATQLGAIRMGSGPRARLRFDRATIDDRFARLAVQHRPRVRRNGQSHSRNAADDRGLLPIRETPA